MARIRRVRSLICGRRFKAAAQIMCVCFCFASRRVIARCPQVLSLDELTAFVKAASGLLAVHVQLAFVQRRQLYAQAKDALSALGEIAPFWLDEEALEEMVRYAEQKASKARCPVHHASSLRSAFRYGKGTWRALSFSA